MGTSTISFLRNSASSFHRLSSSIFTCLFVVRRPSRIVTSPLISTRWCFRPYKPNSFCEDMILATCQCQPIFCCWVEPSLLSSSFYHYHYHNCHYHIFTIIIIIVVLYSVKHAKHSFLTKTFFIHVRRSLRFRASSSYKIIFLHFKSNRVI